MVELTPVERQALLDAIQYGAHCDDGRSDFLIINITPQIVYALEHKGLATYPNGAMDWWDAQVTDEGYRAVGKQPPVCKGEV